MTPGLGFIVSFVHSCYRDILLRPQRKQVCFPESDFVSVVATLCTAKDSTPVKTLLHHYREYHCLDQQQLLTKYKSVELKIYDLGPHTSLIINQ